MSQSNHLHALLRRGSAPWERLLKHADRLAALDRTVAAVLGRPLADHCHLANLRNATLVVHTDASVWASRLRYHTPQLLRTLQGLPDTGTVREIEIKVRPRSQPAATPAQTGSGMSPTAAATLEAAADTMPDGSLRSALRRLASRQRR